jgi:hypothetical protein
MNRYCPICKIETRHLRCPLCGSETDPVDEGYSIFDHAQFLVTEESGICVSDRVWCEGGIEGEVIHLTGHGAALVKPLDGDTLLVRLTSVTRSIQGL